MRKIVVTTIGGRNHQFTDEEFEIGSLKYPSWFSRKSTITIADGTQVITEPKGIFKSGVTVKENDHVLLSTTSNWKGQFVITDVIRQRDYVLKMKGLFSNSYQLTDSNGVELFAIKHIVNWKRFKPFYEIYLTNFDLFHRQNEILLYTAFYCYKNLITSTEAVS